MLITKSSFIFCHVDCQRTKLIQKVDYLIGQRERERERESTYFILTLKKVQNHEIKNKFKNYFANHSLSIQITRFTNNSVIDVDVNGRDAAKTKIHLSHLYTLPINLHKTIQKKTEQYGKKRKDAKAYGERDCSKA